MRWSIAGVGAALLAWTAAALVVPQPRRVPLTASLTDPHVPAPGAAPPMTWHKFVTMSQKRVVVTLNHDALDNLAELTKTKLKQWFPDAIVQLNGDPAQGSLRPASVFEIHVDGKLVWSGERRGVVYLHRERLQAAVEAARRRRRPKQVVYGDPSTFEDFQTFLREERRQRELADKQDQEFQRQQTRSGEAAGGDAPPASTWKMVNPPLDPATPEETESTPSAS